MKFKWENVNAEHVIKAIEEFESSGEKAPKAKSTFLVYKNKRYPAKHIRGIAYRIANGVEIKKTDYSGGKETVSFFEKLGFAVEHKLSGEHDNNKKTKQKKKESQKTGVVDQKNALQILLQKKFGIIETEKKFYWLKTPDVKNPNEYVKIINTLENYRGNKKFFKSNYQLPCDMYLESRNLIVEYDERQHFTLPRKLTLKNYPQNIKLYFSKKDWIKECDKINAKDNNPHNRDEIRAFYDCVRDIESYKNGFKLVRIKHGDYDWCSDGAEKYLDEVLSGYALGKKKATGNGGKIKTLYEPGAKVARVIFKNNWYGDLLKAKDILNRIFDSWEYEKVKFLITCGRFIRFPWPKLNYNNVDYLNPDKAYLNEIFKHSDKYINKLLDYKIKKKLSKITEYITIGIDSFMEEDSSKLPHIELVYLYDLKNNRFYRTGKSFPLTEQKANLIRISDIESHFVSLKNYNVMLLGCHDLKVFEPRQYKRKNKATWREKTIKEFHKLARKNKPRYVLQHPHYTDCVSGKQLNGNSSPGIWDIAWKYLQKISPSIKEYFSAGRYYRKEGKRSKLDDVLARTKKGPSIDIIVSI